jgi:beta-glucanase (GH16 family)
MNKLSCFFIKRVLGIFCTLGFVISTAQAATAWRDDFSGSLRANTWETENGATWEGNNSIMAAGNVSFANGRLRLTHNKAGGFNGKPFSGAELRTWQAFGYGHYTARIQATGAQGLDTGFYMYNNSRYFGNNPNSPFWNEIDFEFLGSHTSEVHTNVFWGNNATSAPNDPKDVGLGFNFSSAEHEYQIRYQKDTIYWYVDGQWKRSKPNNGLLTSKMFLYMNIWAPEYARTGNWPGWPYIGNINNAPTYATSNFDWVNVNEW